MKLVGALVAALGLVLFFAFLRRDASAHVAERAHTDAGAASELATARAELAACRERGIELEDEVARLRAELEGANAKRLDREREWLRYTSGFTALGAPLGAKLPEFRPDVPAGEGAEAAAAIDAPDPRARLLERSAEIHRSLRALLALEDVGGLDLLESGTLGDGWIGPLVVRVLDERGRPLGSMTAERLRLEASRAARTLTLVFEEGCEKRAGASTPFEGGPAGPDGQGGVRRVLVPEVDPRPWIEACPELFSALDKAPAADDGKRNLAAVRAALNQLLREDAAHGYYRLSALGGVQARVLRDVQLDELDANGTLVRKLFADRMSCAPAERGVALLLESGAHVRDDRKVAFLDGRYRIYLPRASVDAWKRSGVPGFDDLAAEPR